MTTATDTSTFYETTIHVDLGDNPHRPRPGRDWLANPYRVHQRIMWAIDGQTSENRPLFRIYRDRVIVRTAGQPDWAKAFTTPPFIAPFLLQNGEVPEPQPTELQLKKGDTFWFDMLYCPPHHTPPGQVLGQTSNGKPQRNRGKRVPLLVRDSSGRVDEFATRQKQLDKFLAHLQDSGFAPADGNSVAVLDRFRLRASKGKWAGRSESQDAAATDKTKRGAAMEATVAVIAGRLTVTEPEAALRTLLAGLGPAKSLGCGMLVLGSTCSPE